MQGTDLGPVEIPLWIDLLSVFVAGIATAFLATKKDLDVTGILIIAIVGALGGGILRDTMIQRGTPAAFTNGSYLITAVIAATIGFSFASQASRVSWLLTTIDAMSLGLYTLVGVLKGLQADLPVLSVILLGVVSGTGGSMLRDILLMKTPAVLLPGAPYAVLSILAAVIAVLLDATHVREEWLWWLPVAVVVILRFITLRLGWQTPVAAAVPAQVQSAIAVPAARTTAPLRRSFRSRSLQTQGPPEDTPDEPDAE